MPRKKQSFESSINKLENIVKDLEQGDMPLDTILKEYKEGINLINFCRSELGRADKTVCDLSEIDSTGTQIPLSIELKGNTKNE
ncbi:exodeoxyribonuclease VII small subunit [Pectinatus sottacetonis]|uniref:exodeoxyribonuclease VII small subunit n=1 Tax=Pectinatus sottacetonis TaxID=1002795 RepID=UPI0018C64428|nr:exodeoxyribonuclease VII small subunit [Pectinatus sottacetonis]